MVASSCGAAAFRSSFFLASLPAVAARFLALAPAPMAFIAIKSGACLSGDALDPRRFLFLLAFGDLFFF